MTPGTKCQRSAAHREKHASRTGTHKLKVREKSQSRYELAPQSVLLQSVLLQSVLAAPPKQALQSVLAESSACWLNQVHAGSSKACWLNQVHAGCGSFEACWRLLQSMLAGGSFKASMLAPPKQACWLAGGRLLQSIPLTAPSKHSSFKAFLLQSIHRSKLCVELTTWL
jgi:hypothetical protein